MQIQTTRFGTLEIDEQEVIKFPSGMLGFEELNDYVLLPVSGNPAFTWLQAVQEPAVAFLLVDPFLFFQGYEVELQPRHEQALQVDGPDQVAVYAVVTIPPSGVKDMMANLVGPVAINLVKKRGLQLVLEGTGYTTRHLLFPRQPGQHPRAAAR
ncbi:MAG: flagellar assembly protein FliW [Bacillota bacterium]